MHKFNTIDRFRNTVSAVNRLDPAPDFVVLTGDLTNDEQEVSYQYVKEILSDLEAPYHLAPGNHDARIPFRRIDLAAGGEVAPRRPRGGSPVRKVD